MRPEERDLAYLWDMREAAREAIQMLGSRTDDEYLADNVLRRAVERCVELVGEAARRVSSEMQAAHPEVAWRGIIGQRNVLAHEYGAIDHSLLYRTATEDLPALDRRLTAILRDAEPDSLDT